jgi:hypothetical protein
LNLIVGGDFVLIDTIGFYSSIINAGFLVGSNAYSEIKNHHSGPYRPFWIFRFKNSTIPENMSHSSRMMEPLVR